MEKTINKESAEDYLYKRLENLNTEKRLIEGRINSAKYEIDEIENKIDEIDSEYDSSYEVFSPKPKDKNFDKREVSSLQFKKNELNELMSSLLNEEQKIEESIEEIKNILKIDMPDDADDADNYDGMSDADDEGIYDGMSDDDNADINNGNNHNDADAARDKNISADINDDSIYRDEYEFEYLSGYKILEQRENERSRLASELQEKSVEPLSKMMHRCEVCSKIVEQDPARTKIEIDIMLKMMKGIFNDIHKLLFNLRPVDTDNAMIDTNANADFDIFLRKIIDRLQSETQIPIELEIKGDKIEVLPVMEKTLLRTVAEGVNSILKFSEEKTLNETNIAVKKIHVLCEYDQYDFNQIHIVIENIIENTLEKHDGNEETKAVKQNNQNKDISDEKIEDTELELIMMKENIYLLGGDMKIMYSDDTSMKIEINIPIIDK